MDFFCIFYDENISVKINYKSLLIIECFVFPGTIELLCSTVNSGYVIGQIWLRHHTFKPGWQCFFYLYVILPASAVAVD